MSEDSIKELYRLLVTAAVSERLGIVMNRPHKNALELAQILLKCLKKEAYVQDMNIHQEVNPTYGLYHDQNGVVTHNPVVTITVKFTR
jgi:hypothetical protein